MLVSIRSIELPELSFLVSFVEETIVSGAMDKLGVRRELDIIFLFENLSYGLLSIFLAHSNIR